MKTTKEFIKSLKLLLAKIYFNNDEDIGDAKLKMNLD